MKTTAVEFLVKGLPMVYWEDPYYSHLLEQAKEMEKQQIIDSYNEGMDNIDGWIVNENGVEDYYNETYKKCNG